MNRSTTFNRNKKKKIIKIMGGKCCLCGYDKCIAALELHHINPEEKEFSFSNYNSYKKLDLLIDELKKCILLCSNCHKEVHYGNESFNLISSFDGTIANDILQDSLVKKEKHYSYCKKCGKEITLHAEYCFDCRCENGQKVDRPNREELKNMIRKISFVEIGKEYGVSDKAIVKWCKKYKLPYRKNDINKIPDNIWSVI